MDWGTHPPLFCASQIRDRGQRSVDGIKRDRTTESASVSTINTYAGAAALPNLLMNQWMLKGLKIDWVNRFSTLATYIQFASHKTVLYTQTV